MSEEDVKSGEGEKKALRPALIVSEKVVEEYSTLLEHLLLGLADESISVVMVCPWNCGVDALLSGSVEVVSYKKSIFAPLRHRRRRLLGERLSGLNPSFLHCLDISDAKFTRRLARQLNVPYILSLNCLGHGFRHFSVSSRRCARILVPSAKIAKSVHKNHPVPGDKVSQVNPGTFISDSDGCFTDPRQVASVVVAHSLDKAVELENMIRAVKHLVVDGYEFVLLIMGDGRGEKYLRKLISSQGLSSVVTIVPKLSNWRAVLAAGDIFVQPQPSYRFNAVLMEAMSVGAAVAGCKGGVDDLIIEDKTAVVFEPGDELSIYGALKRLFDRPELARQLAGAAQQHLREKHTVSGMISAVLRTYHEVSQWHVKSV